jgi:hypothetical protein
VQPPELASGFYYRFVRDVLKKLDARHRFFIPQPSHPLRFVEIRSEPVVKVSLPDRSRSLKPGAWFKRSN